MMPPLRLSSLLAYLVSIAVISCNAFLTLPITYPKLWNGNSPRTRLIKVKSASNSHDTDDTNVPRTITTTYERTVESDRCGGKQQQSSRLQWLRRAFRKNNNADLQRAKVHHYTYDYDEMSIGNTTKSVTTAVMLIHPIGVGIGKWYHDRLLSSLRERYGDIQHRLVFLSPDLLGSATASGPMDERGDPILTVPLLNITDWTDQVTRLMAECEIESEGAGHVVGSWTVIANGGCSPIALKVASDSVRKVAPFKAALTNVIVSSPPRLPFFLEGTDPARVQKSYRTLSGVTGRLFWWYALRRGGRFVQKFSERNLVGDASNLGEEWTPNCLEAAGLFGGMSRYSTFAFLAGALQDGCVESLNALKGSGITIDFIRGTDKRRNRAKSWFWTRKKRNSNAGGDSSRGSEGIDDANNDEASTEETISQYVSKNGNRGKELLIGGRISLAWEDSGGYAKSVLELLCE